MGCCQFGNLGLFVLLNSGVVITMPTKTNHYLISVLLSW